MSDKPGGCGPNTCDACGRRYTWGCGHEPHHEAEMRAHRMSPEHLAGECECFGHDDCDPATCKLARHRTPGYAAFVSHREITSGEIKLTPDGLRA